jgi:hypothetical protein
MDKSQRRSHFRWLWSSASLLIGLAVGCTESQRATIMGPGFNDEFSKTGDDLRPDENGGEHLDGLSTKSQQIERHLRVD